MPHRPINPKLRNVIGPNIQKARIAKGWTQEELARACQLAGWDIDREGIVRIEARRRTLLDYEILKLMELLSVSFDVLKPGRVPWQGVFAGYASDKDGPPQDEAVSS